MVATAVSPSLVKVHLTVKSCRTILNKLRIVEAMIILDVKIVDEHGMKRQC